MSKVCRCCLIESTSMKNLFSFRIKCKNGEEDVSFAEAYNLNTNLSISKDSKLPIEICSNCEEKLIISYKFRIQCRTANKMLSLRSSDVDVDVRKNEDFWDDEFLYNVPSLFKGDFFVKEHLVENQLPCTYEISTDFDIMVDKPTFEDDEEEEEEIVEELFDDKPIEPMEKRTCFKCSACRRIFSKHNFYRVHSEKVHNLDWECEYCEKRFTIETYSDHKRIHSTEPVFTCGVCNGIYNSKPSFTKHRCPGLIPEVDPNKTDPVTPCKPTEDEVDDYFDDLLTSPLQYSCNVCKEDFTSKKKYKIHIKGHEKLALKSKTDKGYLCNFCGLNLTRADSLLSHIRTHTGEKPYGCDICGKYFRQRCSLRNHKQLHTGKQTMCELCPKTFASRAFLRLHMRSHNNERNFKCEVCNKSYLMKHALKEHNRAHHSTIRFKCSYCEKDFTNPSRKRLHETIHTGKRWWCTICDYKATRKNRLKGHIFAIHKLNIDDLNITISETGTAEVAVETAEGYLTMEEDVLN